MARRSVTVRIDSAILERLDVIGGSLGLSRGEQVRNSLIDYIERMESMMTKSKELNKLLMQLNNIPSEDLQEIYQNIGVEISRRNLK